MFTEHSVQSLITSIQYMLIHWLTSTFFYVSERRICKVIICRWKMGERERESQFNFRLKILYFSILFWMKISKMFVCIFCFILLNLLSPPLVSNIIYIWDLLIYLQKDLTNTSLFSLFSLSLVWSLLLLLDCLELHPPSFVKKGAAASARLICIPLSQVSVWSTIRPRRRTRLACLLLFLLPPRQRRSRRRWKNLQWLLFHRPRHLQARKKWISTNSCMIGSSQTLESSSHISKIRMRTRTHG